MQNDFSKTQKQAFEDLNLLITNIHQETIKNHDELIKKQHKFSKKMNIWLGFITGFVSVGVLLFLIKLFI